MELRARVAMHNIANQDTPGFKRSTVLFEERLRAAGDAATVRPEVVRDRSGAPGANNVDVMDELGILMRARLVGEVFSRRAAGHFATLQTAIRGHA